MAAQTPAQRAELAYRQAGELTASGHTNPAIDRALEAIQADPSHLAARRLAAVLLCEKGRFGEAAAGWIGKTRWEVPNRNVDWAAHRATLEARDDLAGGLR